MDFQNAAATAANPGTAVWACAVDRAAGGTSVAGAAPGMAAVGARVRGAVAPAAGVLITPGAPAAL